MNKHTKKDIINEMSECLTIDKKKINAEKIDKKIKPLVDFLNTIPGVKTILSCQGHDDNDNTNPYITFVCVNVKYLNIIARVDWCGYTGIEDYDRDDIPKPQINGSWRVCVASIDEKNDLEEIIEEYDLDIKPDELVFYRLCPDKDSYDKPSDVHDDFNEILKYLKFHCEKYGDEKMKEENKEIIDKINSGKIEKCSEYISCNRI